MLLYPDGDRGKLQRQLRRRKAVNLYCICACPNHPYPLEIFEAKELYKALQEFQCTEETSPLVRVKSRDYSLPGNIKVYETVYSFTLHDESAMQ